MFPGMTATVTKSQNEMHRYMRVFTRETVLSLSPPHRVNGSLPFINRKLSFSYIEMDDRWSDGLLRLLKAHSCHRSVRQSLTSDTVSLPCSN